MIQSHAFVVISIISLPQCAVHLLRCLETVLRSHCQCFQHDALQVVGAVHWRRDWFACKAPLPGCLNVVGGEFGRNERKPVVVQALVQNHSERVDVRAGVRRLHLVYFRRHVSERSFEREHVLAAEHISGHAKIPQLEISRLVHEDVLRLDIPMDDTLIVAVAKALSNVHAELEDNLIAHRIPAHVVRQTGQKLHTDIDIPTDLAVSLPDRIVLIRNNVRVPYETLHDPDLVVDPVHQFLIVGFGVLIIHALKLEPCDFSVAVRHSKDLHRCLLQIAPDISVNFVHSAEAASSKQPHG